MTLDTVNLRVGRRMGMSVIGKVFCLETVLFTFDGAGARAVGVRNGKGKAQLCGRPL